MSYNPSVGIIIINFKREKMSYFIKYTQYINIYIYIYIYSILIYIKYYKNNIYIYR